MKQDLPSRAQIKEYLTLDAEEFRENQIELGVFLDSDTVVPVVVYNRYGTAVQLTCNSYPKGVAKTAERQARPAKYLWIEHAERNAIYAMAKEGQMTDGCIMCILWYPCADCARAIVQSGFVALLCSRPNFSDEKWGEHFKAAQAILKEGGVDVYYYEDENCGWD